MWTRKDGIQLEEIKNTMEKLLSLEEQQMKINEVKKLVGSLGDKLPNQSSNRSILRYLRAVDWDTKRAGKNLEETLKWRLEYQPERIRWEDVAHEAETGKNYLCNYHDKYGRPIIVLRPGFQNTKSVEGQLKYLIYCIEKALSNLSGDSEEIVFIVTFEKWKMSSVSIKLSRETFHLLEVYYSGRMGLTIFYNPPKLFEHFFKIVKPFIYPKLHSNVRFVYPNDKESSKIMEGTFDMEKLECTFGGRNPMGFNYKIYAEQMKEIDKKTSSPTDPKIDKKASALTDSM